MAEETPRNLLRAVEQLLAEKGHASVTLRDITDRAGANVAAVAYHFGSKDALVAEAYRRALEEVTDVQRQRLSTLGSSASLEEVVETWLAPALSPEKSTPREVALWAMIQRGAAEHAPGLMAAVQAVGANVGNEMLVRLQGLLPELPQAELQLRHDLVMGAIATLMGGMLNGPSGTMPSPAQHAFAARSVVAWVVGSLRAPSASN